MHSGVNGTPAERELCKAKESLSFLNRLVSQAERGGMVEFNKALDVLFEASHAMQQLSQGKIPGETVENANTRAGLAAPQSLFGEAIGCKYGGRSFSVQPPDAVRAMHTDAIKHSKSVVVTELQRRRAQQVLLELQLLDEVLRCQKGKHERLQQHASGIDKLLKNSSQGVQKSCISYDDLGYLGKEESGLKYARQQMQQMHLESQAVLTALHQQSRRLGGVGDKMADIMESIGVSNTTILQIVRRNHLDAWLVYGGIIVLIIFMWYIL